VAQKMGKRKYKISSLGKREFRGRPRIVRSPEKKVDYVVDWARKDSKGDMDINGRKGPRFGEAGLWGESGDALKHWTSEGLGGELDQNHANETNLSACKLSQMIGEVIAVGGRGGN